MIQCEEFARACLDRDFEFFTGVPDSTFKSWMSYLERPDSPLRNVTTVNECEATAVATGYHLGTGEIGCVYLQNDGLGKCVNPLTSLTNEEVYSIPLLLMIGWRAEPGVDDAVQHEKMGEILLPLLDLLDIPHEILPADQEGYERALDRAREFLESEGRPFALVVRQNTFEPDERDVDAGPGEMSREEAVRHTVDLLTGDELVVSTTGKLSRELYECRKTAGHGLGTDFYNVGAMGCAQSIGLVIASETADRPVVVLDGDGSLLMQFGAQATAGHEAPETFHHFVFDNEVHESTGGQGTASASVDFVAAAKACGYRNVERVRTADELERTVPTQLDREGPTMTVIKVQRDTRPDLGRPTEPLSELKRRFMANATDKDLAKTDD